MKIADQRRQAILQATQDLITSGASSISVNMVAQKAKVSKSAVFYFFKNKEELIKATIESLSQKSTDLLQGILGSNLNPKNKLLEAMRIFVKNHRRSPVLRNFMINSVMQNKNCQMRIKKREQIFDVFHQIAEEGIQSGEFRRLTADALTTMVLRILDSIMIERIVLSEEERTDPEESFKNLLLLVQK